MEQLQQRLKNIEDALILTCATNKEVLSFREAAKYLDVSASWLYKLTSTKAIPHYKPNGKMCYFKRTELDNWLQANRISTNEEIAEKAQKICLRARG